jgi:hypothetical protein
MLGSGPEPGRDQQCSHLVAVQGRGVRFVVQPRAADMDSRGMIEVFLFDGVPVEPGHRGQPSYDGGAGPAKGFQVPGEALDVRAAATEQPQVMPMAPARERAQVQLVRLAGQAAVISQKPQLTPAARY